MLDSFLPSVSSVRSSAGAAGAPPEPAAPPVRPEPAAPCAPPGPAPPLAPPASLALAAPPLAAGWRLERPKLAGLPPSPEGAATPAPPEPAPAAALGLGLVRRGESSSSATEPESAASTVGTCRGSNFSRSTAEHSSVSRALFLVMSQLGGKKIRPQTRP